MNGKSRSPLVKLNEDLQYHLMFLRKCGVEVTISCSAKNGIVVTPKYILEDTLENARSKTLELASEQNITDEKKECLKDTVIFVFDCLYFQKHL